MAARSRNVGCPNLSHLGSDVKITQCARSRHDPDHTPNPLHAVLQGPSSDDRWQGAALGDPAFPRVLPLRRRPHDPSLTGTPMSSCVRPQRVTIEPGLEAFDLVVRLPTLRPRERITIPTLARPGTRGSSDRTDACPTPNHSVIEELSNLAGFH